MAHGAFRCDERIHEHGVKGFSIDDYEGRKKIRPPYDATGIWRCPLDHGRKLSSSLKPRTACALQRSDNFPVKMDFDGIELS